MRKVELINDPLKLTSEYVGWWVHQKIGDEWHFGTPCATLGYRSKETGSLVAGVVFSNYTRPGGSLLISAAAEPKCGWYDDQTRWEIAATAFITFKVKYLRALVAESNRPSRMICRNFGMKVAHVFKEGAPHGDLLIFECERADVEKHLVKLREEWLDSYKESK